MAKKKAIIIGAGITGLHIGNSLSKKGYEVIVIEKTPKIGGMASSFKYQDFTLDYGPHKFYTQLPGVYDEFKEIVGEGNYLLVKKKNSIRLLGNYFDFPVKLSELILKINPLLSMKIGLDFIKSSLSGRNIVSYEDYFLKGFGRKGYEIIFKGFAEKVWGNPAQLSEELARRRSPASSIFDVLKTIFIKNKSDVNAEYFYYPKKGYGVMCDNLAAGIKKRGGRVILNCAPNRINLKNNKIHSIDIKENNKSKNIICDFVVSSLSIDELPFLLSPKLDAKIIENLKYLKFRSLIIAFVFLKKERALKDNWLFFPEKEFCFNRVAEQKSFSVETCPKGRTVLTAEITCNYKDKLYNLGEDKVKEMVVKDLEKAGLIKKEEVCDFFTRKAGRVYPVYSLEYKKHLREVLNSLNKIENLYSVGRLGLFNYNNADHCIDMAKITSKIILDNKPRKNWIEAIDYFDSYKIVD